MHISLDAWACCSSTSLNVGIKPQQNKWQKKIRPDFSVIVGLTVFLPVVRSVSRSFAPSVCVFLSFISFMLFPLRVCVCEIYGRTETSHHTAPHNRQCLTSLQPKKHPETSQQCINGTAFTTVWPAVTSVPNTHTESITGECDGFLWDVWFGLFLEMLFRVKLPGGQRQFNKKCLQNGL